MARTALVLGAGGFIGSHMVKRLKSEGYFVVGVDIKYPQFSDTKADDFKLIDLRSQYGCDSLFQVYKWDEVYQFAADMGGAGYIFTGAHDADIMHNSATINLNILDLAVKYGVGKIFYSSSACIYPGYAQKDYFNGGLAESDAYPAEPDSEYGWEKLFSERLYSAYARNYGVNVRIARFHNIFGPEGTWRGGKEKAPAAICRKVAEAENGERIEIWGSGKQARSFLYIDECVEGVRRLMDSNCSKPVNIGSSEMVSINELAKIVIGLSGKQLGIKHIHSDAIGVDGRNSNNEFIEQMLGWKPTMKLKDGLKETYGWINSQVALNSSLPD